LSIKGNRTLQTQDTSAPGHFGTSAKVSRQFGPKTLHPQDTSSPRHFGTSVWMHTNTHTSVCVIVCFSLCVIIVFFLIVIFTYSAL